MRKNKILIIFFTLFLSGLLFGNNAYASNEDIMKKWTRINVYDCLKNDNALQGPLKVNELSGKVLDSAVGNSQSKLLPSYGFAGTTDGKTLNCRQVIGETKYGHTSLMDYGGITSYGNLKWQTGSPSAIDDFLVNRLKYTGVESSDGGGRFTIVGYRKTESITYPSIGSPISASNEATPESAVVTVEYDASDGKLHYTIGKGNFWNEINLSFENHNLVVKVRDAKLVGCFGGGEKSIPLLNDLNAFYDSAEQALTNITWTVSCTTTLAGPSGFSSTTEGTDTYTFGVKDKVINSSEIVEYQAPSMTSELANEVNSTSTGGIGRGLSPTERYQLYDFYLDKVLSSAGAAANKKTCNPSNTTNLTKVTLYYAEEDKFTDCYVNFNGHDPSEYTVNVPSSDNQKIISVTMQTVIDWFNTVNTDMINKSEINGIPKASDPFDDPTTSGGQNGSSGNTSNDPESEGCYKEAGAMGWIICPLIFGLRDAANGIYEKYIEPLIAVSSSTVEQLRGGDSADKGLYKTWEVFRNVANIIFVVMLLVVIISQLTGLGIDNYGIKKTLPRLIISIILVNLSFIICAICVDLSNIIGNSLRSMFEGMASGIPLNLNTEVLDAAGIGVAILTTLVSTLAVGAGVVGIISTFQAGAGWTIILPVLMFLLGAIIAIIFIFITLGARQALVIVMVAIAPMAFVCYLLPNTNTLFKKWVKLFEGLLLVYPIASILIGGGYLASRVILSGNESDFFVVIVGGLAAFVPYFFIPSIVSKSMQGFGNLGAAIRGFGDNFHRGLDRNIRNSQGFRNAEQRRLDAKQLGSARREIRRAYTRDKDGNLVPRKNMSAARAKRVAAAAAIVSDNDNEVLNAKANMGLSGLSQTALSAKASKYRATERQRAIDDRVSALQDRFDKSDIKDVSSYFRQNYSTMEEEDIAAHIDYMQGRGKEGQEELESMIGALSQDADFQKSDARRQTAQHLNSHYANTKDKYPTLIDWANANRTGDGTTLASHYGHSIGDLNNDAYKGIRKSELGQIADRIEQVRTDNAGEADRSKWDYSALLDGHDAAGLKTVQTDAYNSTRTKADWDYSGMMQGRDAERVNAVKSSAVNAGNANRATWDYSAALTTDEIAKLSQTLGHSATSAEINAEGKRVYDEAQANAQKQYDNAVVEGQKRYDQAVTSAEAVLTSQAENLDSFEGDRLDIAARIYNGGQQKNTVVGGKVQHQTYSDFAQSYAPKAGKTTLRVEGHTNPFVVHRAPDGFGPYHKVEVVNNGGRDEIVMTNAQGDKFNATTNELKPHT